MVESLLLLPVKISLYQSLLSSANWIIILGRFVINYAFNTLFRYCITLRKGHMKAMQKVFGYTKYTCKEKFLIDFSQPDIWNNGESAKAMTG